MRKSTLVFLFNDKAQILLCMKKRWFGVWKWNWSGWKVGFEESVIESASRELLEETAISISSDKLKEVWILHYFWDWKEDWNQSVYVFISSYNWEFQETDEMNPQWWNISEIPYEEMWDNDRIWLPRVLNGENIEWNFYFDIDGKFRDHHFIK